MIYKYHAYNSNKQIAAGTIEAVSEKNAEEALYQAGFKYVLDLQAKFPRPTIYQLIPSLFGVKTSDIIDFSRQLAAFLETGSSLHGALDLLEAQATKPAMRSVISEIIISLEQGISFSQIIKEHSRIFPHSYWQIIQSCEKTGELEKGLKQIADYMENRSKVTENIKRAMAYPAFVICLGIGVVILLVTMVLPPILKLFSSYNTELPLVTSFAISIINFFTNYKVPILMAIVFIAVSGVLFYKLPRSRKSFDRLILKIPVFGPLIIQHNLGIYCRVSSMLLKAGLPLPNILDVAVQSVNSNGAIKNSFTNLKEKLMQGEGMAQPMEEDPLFPPMMVRMIKVGEQTGTLESSLGTLAAHYEESTNKKINSLVGMIEPTLTICIGIGIAFVMYSMIIPIYKVMGSMH